MFVGRRSDNTIYGMWTSCQPDDEFHTGMEELDDEHRDVVAFIQRPLPKPVDPRDTKLDDMQSKLSSLGSLQQHLQAIASIKTRLDILESKSTAGGQP